MPTVQLSFSPDPAYVRTVRLVAAAVARRAGLADESLDEVRLAIGEACARAVALHRRHGLPDLIDVALIDDTRFTVRVVDRSPNDGVDRTAAETTGDIVAQAAAAEGPAVDEDALAAGVGLALLQGLVSDLRVEPGADGKGTEVRMSWPLPRRASR